MSWSDVFPVFTDDQVLLYQKEATPSDLALLEEWCGVARMVNPQAGKHLVATSLFWKPSSPHERELPPITRELMKNARKLGLSSRFDPWPHYVQPLLDGAKKLKEARPEVVFRVYLAADLEFLVPDLVEVGCEVALMKSSSLRHSPGAMWRFLALEERDRWVTITDSDRAPDLIHDVERTELAMKSGLGAWRVPYIFRVPGRENDPGCYRPIIACQFGAVGGYPMAMLMRAFLWHTQRGTMPNQCTVGPKKRKNNKLDISGTDWPTYGFDEWFLLAALYPRLAFGGMLTFLFINQRELNNWFLLDIEYVTWANPQSEILHVGESDLLKRKKAETKPAPRSAILEKMLAEKRDQKQQKTLETMGADAASQEAGRPRPACDIHESRGPRAALLPCEPLTLVVARYKEELDWLVQVPTDVTIVLYNNGPELENPEVMSRVNHFEQLHNRGREADTYLHHLQKFKHGPKNGWTAFCQGDPFPHSPDLLKLIARRGQWAEVQALSAGYTTASDIPPAHLRVLEDANWLGDIPIYLEPCSAGTLDMLGWDDPGIRRMMPEYFTHNRLPRGWSLSGHFLESCGLDKLAEQAWRASLMQFAYGAQFAVRNDRLRLLPKKCLPKMRKLACGHYVNGYVFERMWLHFFGLPFITVERSSVPRREK